MLVAKTKEEREEARLNFIKGMKHLELDLKRRNTKYFRGEDLPGMLDYMIWPWMERIDVISMVFPQLKPLLPPDDFPLLVLFLFAHYVYAIEISILFFRTLG